jgi:hypothetical protein
MLLGRTSSVRAVVSAVITMAIIVFSRAPSRFLERDGGDSGGRARQWRCYPFLLSGMHPIVVGLCFMRRRRSSFLSILAFSYCASICCPIMVGLYWVVPNSRIS